MEAHLERRKRYFPRPWHNRNHEMENIDLFQSGPAEQLKRKMDDERNSGDKIKERNGSGDEHMHGRIDRCAERPPSC